MNARIVLDAIRREHPITRAEVSRLVGISKPTASSVLEFLLDVGLVRETEHTDEIPRGRAVFFEPDPDHGAVLALHLDGWVLRGVLGDLTGEVRAEREILVEDHSPTALAQSARRLRDLLLVGARGTTGAVDTVVMAVPGVGDGHEDATGDAGLAGAPLAEHLTAALGVPAIVDNDVHLSAIGEQARGAGRGVDNFAYVSLHTGVRVGLVLDGTLRRGPRGAAGQLAPESQNEDGVGIADRLSPIVQIADVNLVVLGGEHAGSGDDVVELIREELGRRVDYVPEVTISELGRHAAVQGALTVGVRAATARRLGFPLTGSLIPAPRNTPIP